MTPATISEKIVVYGGNLYTTDGLPLYRYVPLAPMVKARQGIPWASQWDPYILAWVMNYTPLPETSSDSPAVRAGLKSQPRTGAKRDYLQAVFRGWPLYTCAFDSPGFALAPQGTTPGLFELVSVEEPWVRPEDSPVDGWPPAAFGP
ncbi:hypothetical protein [Deinococcus aquiradiocola]|uniref:Uncharacterized protein n=1 Tax=Deinococcus aquiradiocola TaxID=393059 RepID=A0A917UMU2_9DEIO|nr:hypothetical protein [Deinococcus aquiradiocola]GGJ69409.1 hypothetical protein GCM10008939_12250 [Deinococcus aquiradiocola]